MNSDRCIGSPEKVDKISLENISARNDLNQFALLGKFTSILSHQIGNSLCKIKMNLDVYKEEFKNNNNLERVYETIYSEITHLSKLSNDIKQYLKKSEDIPIKINVFNLFENVREKVSKRLSDKKIIYINHAENNLIVNDYIKVQTAFLILINSMIDSMGKDDIIEITSGMLNDTAKVVVIIRNEGKFVILKNAPELELSLLIFKQLITVLGGSTDFLFSDDQNTKIEVQL